MDGQLPEVLLDTTSKDPEAGTRIKVLGFSTSGSRGPLKMESAARPLPLRHLKCWQV